MILGSSKQFKGKGYVCFMDVLGFSNDILANWGSAESNPLEKMLAIKRDMPGFDVAGKDDGSQSRRLYVCRVSTVSDSVTICFGYSEDIIVGDLVLGLEAVLANVAYVWSTFVLNGYTIRGAIDFGDVYWDESELIGPALINAYRLESQVARNSRVVVSSSLNRVFSDLAQQHRGPLIEHLFKSFTRDVDGYVIVNPRILYGSPEERDALVEALVRMRDALPRGIVREKYNPLISMLGDGEPWRLSDGDVGRY